MNDKPDLKVGDSVWIFDPNRRVYEKTGGLGARCIYREHFVEHKITGENRVSWILQYGWKIPKKRDKYTTWKHTQSEIDDACYVMDYRHKIAEKIHHISDAGLLRQIGNLVGFKPNTK